MGRETKSALFLEQTGKDPLHWSYASSSSSVLFKSIREQRSEFMILEWTVHCSWCSYTMQDAILRYSRLNKQYALESTSSCTHSAIRIVHNKNTHSLSWTHSNATRRKRDSRKRVNFHISQPTKATVACLIQLLVLLHHRFLLRTIPIHNGPICTR